MVKKNGMNYVESVILIMENSSVDVKKGNMNNIEIDDKHTYFVGQYGPCIKYKENGKTKYKSAKKDLDIDKLRRGEYTLEEILKPANCVLGKYKDKEIILKEGKWGKYVTWNNKNVSIKNLKDITLERVIPLLTAKNPKIIRDLRSDLSVRKGKWGPYIFYKNPRKTKPDFLKLHGCKLNIHNCAASDLIDWIKEKHNI